MLLDILVILCEVIALVAVSSSVLCKTMGWKEKYLTAAYIVLSTAAMEMFNLLPINPALSLFMHIIYLVYCFLLCKKVWLALFSTACGIAVVTILEMILSVPSLLLTSYVVLDNRYISLAVSFVSMLLALYLVRRRGLGAELCKVYQNLQGKGYLILLIIIIFLLFLYEIKNSTKISLLDFLVFSIYFITIFWISYLWRKESIKNLRQKYETEQMVLYGRTYDTILKEMHARQHEFNNHLNNLVNMHVMYLDYDTLVEHQTSYMGILKQSYKYSKLLDTKQPIISGFLYMIFVKYEDVGADVEYNVDINDVTQYIPVIDLTELLGVLIDNAFQALASFDGIEKKVKIFLEEMGGQFFLTVLNTLPGEMKYQELIHFFDAGYSTKGNGHGLGLFNMKNIVNRHHGEIVIQSFSEKDDAWIEIGCKIRKKQKK
ncbi:MAG: GHKL domain-containing protein [Clostridiaceae bacterium]|nr:GHKL domain-containing protein [Clostridiaceae bacterium]